MTAALNIIIFATGIGIITMLSLVQKQFENKFEKSIEGREDVEFQIQLTSKLQRLGPVRSEFWNFNEVKYLDQPDKWQDFILDTILEAI